MRIEIRRALTTGGLVLAAFMAGASPASRAQSDGALGGPSDDEMAGGAPQMDEIIATLIGRFGKTKHEAQDAAIKLGQMGKRVVPILSDVLVATEDVQVKWYAVYALSRIRDKGAARALLPILKDKDAEADLRLMAIEAVSGTDLPEGVKPLQQIATNDENGDLRFKALNALSVMVGAWPECEPIFVERLGDERDDIRQLAAQLCYQAAAVRIYYYSAEAKLIEMAEAEPLLKVRFNAIAALARMKSRLAVKKMIELLGPESGAPEQVKAQALKAAWSITGVPFRNQDAARVWWEKYGKAQYEKAGPLMPPEALAAREKAAAGPPEPPAAGPTNPPAAALPGRKLLPLDDPQDRGFDGAAIGE